MIFNSEMNTGQVASVRSRSQAPGGCGMIAVRSVYDSTCLQHLSTGSHDWEVTPTVPI